MPCKFYVGGRKIQVNEQSPKSLQTRQYKPVPVGVICSYLQKVLVLWFETEINPMQKG